MINRQLLHFAARSALLALAALLAALPARAEPFHPIFSLDEGGSSKVFRTFLQPQLRQRGVHPRIVTELSEIRLEVGETVLVPVFSQTEDGLPVPVKWTLENNIASIAGATIDEARPYGLNGFTASAYGFRGNLPSQIAGPRASQPAQSGLGCERRYFLNNRSVFYDGHHRSQWGAKRLTPSAYVCLHGRAPGKGEVYVGEETSSLDFARETGRSVALIRPPYLSAKARTGITVEMVAPSGSGLSEEMAMAETVVSRCDLDACILTAIPLNRGGERLDCTAPGITVSWQYNNAIYQPVRQQNCTIELKPKFLPPVSSPAFDTGFQVSAIVMQTTDRPVTSSSGTITVKTVKQAFGTALLHPLNVTETEAVKWARAICPVVIVPGQSFSCLISVVSDTGNPPGPFSISSTAWQLPQGVTFTGFAKSNGNVACFHVDETLPDGAVGGILGRLDNGLIFHGSRMAVSRSFGSFLSGSKPRDCPA